MTEAEKYQPSGGSMADQRTTNVAVAGEPCSSDREQRTSDFVRLTGDASRDVAPESTPQVWSDCSSAYEAFATAVTEHFAVDAIRLARLGPGSAVLDVGAGTGAFTLAAARMGTQVLGTDFSPQMIRLLQRKCRSLAYQNVQTAVMDGQNLELDDERFDVAASLFSLMFFPDHERGLREIHRVLRPGGQVVVATWAPPQRVELMRLMGDAMFSAGVSPPANDHVPHWLNLCHPARLRARLESVGFEKVHIVTVAHVSVFEEATELARVLPASTPSSASLLAAMTDEERERFFNALVTDFLERQGEGPYAVSNEALIAVGSKPRTENP